MSHDRLKRLLEFYSEDPDDPFNIYALANEYKNSDPQKALDYFEILLKNHPNYIATYYHLAHLYLDIGAEEKAKDVFERGIDVAAAKNENFALRELKSAYDEFMMDY